MNYLKNFIKTLFLSKKALFLSILGAFIFLTANNPVFYAIIFPKRNPYIFISLHQFAISLIVLLGAILFYIGMYFYFNLFLKNKIQAVYKYITMTAGIILFMSIYFLIISTIGLFFAKIFHSLLAVPLIIIFGLFLVLYVYPYYVGKILMENLTIKETFLKTFLIVNKTTFNLFLDETYFKLFLKKTFPIITLAILIIIITSLLFINLKHLLNHKDIFAIVYFFTVFLSSLNYYIVYGALFFVSKKIYIEFNQIKEKV